jgi:hypothetical protein
MKIFLLASLTFASSFTAFASASMDEGNSFLMTLESTQKMKGSKGCENIKISKSESGELNYYLQLGPKNTVKLLNKYMTLSDSVKVDSDSFEVNYATRGGSLVSLYPYKETKIKLVKSSHAHLATLEYSYLEKESFTKTTSNVKMKCTEK